MCWATTPLRSCLSSDDKYQPIQWGILHERNSYSQTRNHRRRTSDYLILPWVHPGPGHSCAVIWLTPLFHNFLPLLMLGLPVEALVPGILPCTHPGPGDTKLIFWDSPLFQNWWPLQEEGCMVLLVRVHPAPGQIWDRVHRSPLNHHLIPFNLFDISCFASSLL